MYNCCQQYLYNKRLKNYVNKEIGMKCDTLRSWPQCYPDLDWLRKSICIWKLIQFSFKSLFVDREIDNYNILTRNAVNHANKNETFLSHI